MPSAPRAPIGDGVLGDKGKGWVELNAEETDESQSGTECSKYDRTLNANKPFRCNGHGDISRERVPIYHKEIDVSIRL